MCRREFGPLVLTEEAPADGKYSPAQVGSTGPFAGPVWYNSLYWTNFPPLNCFDERQWAQHQDSDFFAGLSELNSDGRLAEQYVTFGAAREDLCQNARMPKASRVLKAEVMQYDGVRDLNWHFPLQSYIPKRGNHTPYEVQSRRFHDNGVINFGLNAEEFSDSVMPVSDLDACITTNDYTGYPGMGYFFTLLRIGGWPYRISKIGTFDGLGEGGRTELNIGMSGYGEQVLWQLLEGGPTHAPTGSEGQMEIQGCQRTGCRYWCQLYDLDWLGPKKDESLAYDPEIPPEKGYVWFRVVDSTVLPSTGKKAVRIQLLEDGIVPAWMDLHFLQVWVGDVPLGYLNEATADVDFDGDFGRVKVFRTLEDGGDDRGTRKVVVQNGRNHLVFAEPLKCEPNDLVDLGWALRSICYRGARLVLGSRPGAWTDEVPGDVPASRCP